jgi:hypothetical protein
MTRIVKEEYFDGSKEKLERLGLWPLIDEIKTAITTFPLELKKEIHANGAATLRELIDDALRDVGDWPNAASGAVDDRCGCLMGLLFSTTLWLCVLTNNQRLNRSRRGAECRANKD